MDILFITVSNDLRLREEVNGSLLLATKLLQADFRVDVLRFCQFDSWRRDYSAFIGDITRRILQIGPRCLSFYCLCDTYHISLRIAMEIRKLDPSITIVFGGPQATVTAQTTMETMDCVDYVATGEGESTVVPFFTALLREQGRGVDQIPGLFYRENGAVCSNTQPVPFCDLDALPRWEDSLLPPEEGRCEPDITAEDYFMPIDTGRGCPYNCTFCSTSYFWHRVYRLKSAERIVADMSYYHEKYGIRSFDVAHDAFTVNRALVEQVCDKILERKLDVSWRCTTRIDCISRELILKMKQAGLRRIALGVETGSPRMQKLIKKRLDLEKIKPMVEFLVENDIKVTLFFMFGFPEETEADLQDTLELVLSCIDMGIRRTTMAMCQFDPCTELTMKYYDRLEFDPDNALLCGGFGCSEETAMIRDNKFMFSFRYHLNTQVRNTYRYLYFFVLLYMKHRGVMSYIRAGYRQNLLQFYKDFYSCNRQFFENEREAAEMLQNRSCEMVYAMLEQLPIPKGRQIKARMEFGNDVKRIAASKEDMVIRKTYDFSLIDYQMKVPMEKLTAARSEILLEKKDGMMDMKLLDLRYI